MKKKIIIGSIICLILSGAGYVSYSKKSTIEPAQALETARSVEVVVHTVREEPIVLTEDLSGRVSAFQVAEIRPQVSGIILERMFKEGSLVKKGQQLYQIDSATYKASYDKALAGLASAEADLKAVKPKSDRYTRLVKVGGISQQEYDDVIAALAQAEAGIEVAKANVKSAKINLDYTRVFAPITGRIGRSNVTAGALVTSGQTDPLATIQKLDQIYVDVNQSSQDLMRFRKQMSLSENNPKATLLLNSEGDIYGYPGEILFSDVTVDQGTGMVQLRIRFPNPETELLPGSFVRARVEQFRQEKAIAIPQQSVIRSADGRILVWKVDEASGTVDTCQITVSHVMKDKWIVTSGLESGDRVVVEGVQKIRPMAKITPKEFSPSNS